MTSKRLIEYDIARKMVFTTDITNAPAKTVFMVTDEDTFHTARSTFITEFRRNNSEALAPTYSEVVNVWLLLIE